MAWKVGQHSKNYLLYDELQVSFIYGYYTHTIPTHTTLEYVYICIYIHIYKERGRETEREKESGVGMDRDRDNNGMFSSNFFL